MKRKLPVLLAGIIILFTLCYHYRSEKIAGFFAENTASSEYGDSMFLQQKEKFPEAESPEEEAAAGSMNAGSADEEGADGDGTDNFSEGELPGHLKYYYGTLSDEDKLLYREIYVIIRDHLDYTQVNTTDSDRIADVMEYVLFDNPELFYVDSLNTQTTTVGSTSTMKIMAEEFLTESEQKTASQKISEFSANALAGITSDMSEYDKALHIYEYVVSHLQYVDGALYNQSLYSAALGQTVCRGYACAFKYLCDQADISCIIVTGTMQGQSHAWNQVCIEGKWCYVDCTAGDDLEGKSIAVDYSWFGMDYGMLSQSHEVSHLSVLPAADSLENLYYYRMGRYFDSYSADNLTELLSGGSDFSFQCSTEDVYDRYCSELSENQEIAQAVGPGKQVQFMGNGTTYTVYIQFR